MKLYLSGRACSLQTRVLVRETLEEANKFERLPSAWATGGCGVKRILSGRACSYKEKRLTTRGLIESCP